MDRVRPSRAVTRSRSCSAALRENVSASTRLGSAPSSIRRTMASTRVVVLPVPGPASTSSGPPAWSTTACWCSSSATRVVGPSWVGVPSRYVEPGCARCAAGGRCGGAARGGGRRHRSQPNHSPPTPPRRAVRVLRAEPCVLACRGACSRAEVRSCALASSHDPRRPAAARGDTPPGRGRRTPRGRRPGAERRRGDGPGVLGRRSPGGGLAVAGAARQAAGRVVPPAARRALRPAAAPGDPAPRPVVRRAPGRRRDPGLRRQGRDVRGGGDRAAAAPRLHEPARPDVRQLGDRAHPGGRRHPGAPAATAGTGQARADRRGGRRAVRRAHHRRDGRRAARARWPSSARTDTSARKNAHLGTQERTGRRQCGSSDAPGAPELPRRSGRTARWAG